MEDFFTVEELLQSTTARQRGIPNVPTAEHRQNLIGLISTLLTPLRRDWANLCRSENLGTPGIIVTSGYRGPDLNRAVGGSKQSAHCVGFAADLVPTNRQLLRFKQFCRNWLSAQAFDQMISEHEQADGTPQWIHLGWKAPDGRQRKQFLSESNGQYYPQSR